MTVFCKPCTHCFLPPGCGYKGAQCKAHPVQRSDFYESYRTFRLCSEVNKKNDCTKFAEPLEVVGE